MSLPKPTLDDLRIERNAEPESSSRLWMVVVGIFVLVAAGGVALWLKGPGAVPVRTTVAREATGAGIERMAHREGGVANTERDR